MLPDAAIVDAAVTAPETPHALGAMAVFRGRSQRRLTNYWFAALQEAAGLDADELPHAAPPNDGPPPVARWSDRDPDAAARLTAARAVLAEVGGQWTIPVENLLLPDLLRRLCWTPPTDGDMGTALRKGGAREWQVELLSGLLESALGRPS